MEKRRCGQPCQTQQLTSFFTVHEFAISQTGLHWYVERFFAIEASVVYLWNYSEVSFAMQTDCRCMWLFFTRQLYLKQTCQCLLLIDPSMINFHLKMRDTRQQLTKSSKFIMIETCTSIHPKYLNNPWRRTVCHRVFGSETLYASGTQFKGC